ncbi:hypothetical protein FACS1894139_12870 [Planctomycetales bacterium]|nr:hypothetical protein FACS1894107_05930 [Planctomycetales bacterium]GHT00821.1 hypothetical protein FACS1894108_13800 [Planctomycetales bacterium]GHT06615.1 hypothetical protein FACS1894139_12870 [Planctomycetales bacterium]
MEEQPAISVIVPVYNMEKYLRQCLDSIVGQTLCDIEIIIVNDGSKDGSLAIIREYAARDQRIRVIDQPNEGYGKTMNRGLAAATGEYIGIVESDDWLEADMYETLYTLATMNNADVVKSRYIMFADENVNNQKTSNLPEPDAGKIINPLEYPAIFYYTPSIWCAIYRADFLHGNDIRFLASPSASYQDTAFNFKVWAAARRVWLTMKPLLHYRLHANQSIKAKDNIFCVCDEFDEVDRWLKSRPALAKQVESVKNRAKYNVYNWNMQRLVGENKSVFQQRFAAEFIPILNNNQIDMSGWHYHDQLKVMKNLYPDNTWLKIKLLLSRIGRIFYKYRNRCGYEVHYLFGCIPLFKQPIKNEGAGK